MRLMLFTFLVIFIIACNPGGTDSDNTIPFTIHAPIIDGAMDDQIWDTSPWRKLDQRWLGNLYSSDDFSGRYKLTWNEEALYLLAEITDDVLYDKLEDPLQLWWDDDCLEIFIDEDASGGDHQYNHSAFAYHVALNGHVIDLGPDSLPHFYNDHVMSATRTMDKTTTWECKVLLFDDTFKDGVPAEASTLVKGKEIGFALAYCDNDGSPERENFIGSTEVEGEDKNRGWIDAGIFDTMILE